MFSKTARKAEISIRFYMRFVVTIDKQRPRISNRCEVFIFKIFSFIFPGEPTADKRHLLHSHSDHNLSHQNSVDCFFDNSTTYLQQLDQQNILDAAYVRLI